MRGMTGLVVVLLLSATVTGTTLRVYVSTDGRDSNAGTAELPVYSLHRAAEIVADAIQDGGVPEAGVEVLIGSGVYSYDRPLMLDKRFTGTKDAPIVFRSADQDKAVFDGGQQISLRGMHELRREEDLEKLSAAAKGKVYWLSVRQADLKKSLSDHSIRMTLDDRMMHEARWPNVGYGHVDTIYDKGAVYAHGRTKGDPPTSSMEHPVGGIFSVGNKDVRPWEKEFSRTKDVMLIGYLSYDWYKERHRIARIDDGKIQLEGYSRYGILSREKIPRRLIVKNLLCELDQPGEYYYEKQTGRLFFWPFGEITDDSRLSAWTGPSFAVLRDTSYVRFENLIVQGCSRRGPEEVRKWDVDTWMGKATGKAAVYISGGEGNAFAGCVIRNCSIPAACVEGGQRNGIRSCDVYDVPHHLTLTGGNVRQLQAAGNYAENCHFTQVQAGDFYGRISLSGVGNIFRHNLVHNFVGQVFTFADCDHVIEYNEFFNIGIEEGDGGTLYSGASMWSYGNVLRRNFLHHLMCVPEAHPRGGIYPDDHDAGDTIVENVFYKAAHRAVLINGGAGHTVSRNVFLKGHIGIYNTEAFAEKHVQMAPQYESGELKRGDKMDYVWRTEQVVGEEGWNKEPWASHFPKFRKIMNQEKMRYWPIECVFADNVFCQMDQHIQYRTGWGSDDLKDIQEVEHIETRGNRVITMDVFRDSESLDFRYKAGAGEDMPETDFEHIGLVKDVYRTTVPDKQRYRAAVRKAFAGRKSYDAKATYDPATINEQLYVNTGAMVMFPFSRATSEQESYKVASEDYKYAMRIYNAPETNLVFPNPHPDAQWFPQAGLGLFIHWGIHSVKALQPSWAMIKDYPYAHLPEDEDPSKYIGLNYYHLAEQFNPKSYDPNIWLEAAADAGFRYAVLTAKHHDGYALWPSKYGDMSTRTYMGGRDLIKDYVEACRNNGLKVGFYFSPRDWHYPGFPVYDVGFDHNRRGEKYNMSDDEAKQLYMDFYAYTISQLRELLTHYGKIDVLWFDGLGAWPGVKEKRGDTKVRQTYAWIRSLHPEIVINDRWDKRIGDFGTPEMHVPEKGLDGWWESCIAIKGHWGYSPESPMWSIEKFCNTYKSIREKGGNFLANIGPSPYGTMPQEFYELCETLQKGACEN